MVMVGSFLIQTGAFAAPDVYDTAPRKLPLEIRVADDVACSFCVKLKNEMYGEGGAKWRTLPPARAYGLEMIFFQYRIEFKDTPHLWPDWFKEALAERDVAPPRGTPAIYVWDTESNMPIHMIPGYPGVERTVERIMLAVRAYILSQELYPSK